jgi:hypothetical protein
MKGGVKMRKISFVSSIMLCMLAGLFFAGSAEAMTLFDFEGGFKIDSVSASEADISVTREPPKGALRLRTGKSQRWPGVTLKAAEGKWDLSGYKDIILDVHNLDGKPVTVNCRVDNPGADGVKNCVTHNVTVDPHSQALLVVPLHDTPWKLSEPLELVGMRGFPRAGGLIDTTNVTQLIVFVTKPDKEHDFAIDNIRTRGKVHELDSKTFLPFIDEFGQFIHADWPGKLKSENEFEKRKAVEQKDLAAKSSDDEWNKYGGWAKGPKLKATGFFRTEKYNNKWWLVDPEGRLYWSHGVDCVHPSTSTPISDRKHYFKALPAPGSDLGKFYGRGSWAPHGYYAGRGQYESYDLFKANLVRKYGGDWQKIFADLTHRRLRSWGLNTIANWSDSGIYLMRKTPYTGTINFNPRNIEGSEGYWRKFPDPFDKSFTESLQKSLQRQKDTTANDPWCIGYFVHNELGWGDEVSLSTAALLSPADQPVKKVFIEDLKAKYGTIDKLNSAWQSDYTSWGAMLEGTEKPDRENAHDDLTAFYTKIAEEYFRVIRDEIKKVAPNQLYMGCRFAWVNDRVARAAAKYCDIVCYNRYYYSVANLALPDNIDIPIIIGEFHFGALDRGMFHTGLKKTLNQMDRAEKYKSYVQGALANPYIVGTHWFQYKDQATTGRGDGENYQIGFVDITDTPYPETIDTVRYVGYNMYKYRMQN